MDIRHGRKGGGLRLSAIELAFVPTISTMTGHINPGLLATASHEKNQPDVEQELAGCNMCSAITQHVYDVDMSGVE